MNSIQLPQQSPVFNHSTLIALLQDYARPNDKISDMLAKAELLPLKRGLYTLGGSAVWSVSRGLVANHLHGPSYVSREWMLAYYGWITERVEEITSMCLERSRSIGTPLGRFSYAAIPARYYAVGLTFVQEREVAFMAATPEKALCDLLVATPRLRLQSVGAMQRHLLDDLRLDESDLQGLDTARLHACAHSGYKTVMLTYLCQLVEVLKHD
jgi:hypothetical protein